jgi:hypothetical protein
VITDTVIAADHDAHLSRTAGPKLQGCLCADVIQIDGRMTGWIDDVELAIRLFQQDGNSGLRAARPEQAGQQRDRRQEITRAPGNSILYQDSHRSTLLDAFPKLNIEPIH